MRAGLQKREAGDAPCAASHHPPFLDLTTVPLPCAQKSSKKSTFGARFSETKVLKTLRKFKTVRKSIPRIRTGNTVRGSLRAVAPSRRSSGTERMGSLGLVRGSAHIFSTGQFQSPVSFGIQLGSSLAQTRSTARDNQRQTFRKTPGFAAIPRF